MTIREFILECENYEHSKEHYQLLKEASELDLLNQFISDQEYMRENTMDDGFYQESVDDDQLEYLIETAAVQEQNVLQKVVAFIGELIEKFLNFLRGLGKKTDELENEIKEISDSKDIINTLNNVTGSSSSSVEHISTADVEIIYDKTDVGAARQRSKTKITPNDQKSIEGKSQKAIGVNKNVIYMGKDKNLTEEKIKIINGLYQPLTHKKNEVRKILANMQDKGIIKNNKFNNFTKHALEIVLDSSSIIVKNTGYKKLSLLFTMIDDFIEEYDSLNSKAKKKEEIVNKLNGLKNRVNKSSSTEIELFISGKGIQSQIDLIEKNKKYMDEWMAEFDKEDKEGKKSLKDRIRNAGKFNRHVYYKDFVVLQKEIAKNLGYYTKAYTELLSFKGAYFRELKKVLGTGSRSNMRKDVE